MKTRHLHFCAGNIVFRDIITGSNSCHRWVTSTSKESCSICPWRDGLGVEWDNTYTLLRTDITPYRAHLDVSFDPRKHSKTCMCSPVIPIAIPSPYPISLFTSRDWKIITVVKIFSAKEFLSKNNMFFFLINTIHHLFVYSGYCPDTGSTSARRITLTRSWENYHLNCTPPGHLDNHLATTDHPTTPTRASR